MDEAKLLEKLRAIEALFAGATTPGERAAAADARARIQLRLDKMAEEAPPVEYRFTLADGWSRKLFMALCRRYGGRAVPLSRSAPHDADGQGREAVRRRDALA